MGQQGKESPIPLTFRIFNGTVGLLNHEFKAVKLSSCGELP